MSAPRGTCEQLAGTWALGAPLSVLVTQHLLPSVLGRASENVVTWIERASHGLSLFEVILGALLSVMALWGLVTTSVLGGLKRAVLLPVAFTGIAPVMAIASGAIVHGFVFGTIAISGLVLALLGAAVTLPKNHTRAAGLGLVAGGVTAALRLAAWYGLNTASETASPTGYARGVFLCNLSLVAELILILTMSLWLSTRGGAKGRVFIQVALASALGCTLLRGSSADVEGWRALLFAGESMPASLPATWDKLAQFLSYASLMGGAAFIAGGISRSRVAPCIGLILLSRGAFDMPLRFMLLLGAVLLLMRSATDPRGLWDELLGAKGAEPPSPAA